MDLNGPPGSKQCSHVRGNRDKTTNIFVYDFDSNSPLFHNTAMHATFDPSTNSAIGLQGDPQQ